MTTHYLLKQQQVIRNVTIDAVTGINEEDANFIPFGFNNNIRWHLGHIYVVQEKLAFDCLGLQVEIPEKYSMFFGPGTSPNDWNDSPPTLDEIIFLLKKQASRMQENLNALTSKVAHPFQTKSGLILETGEQLLTFSLYHEGVHVSAINSFKKIIANSK